MLAAAVKDVVRAFAAVKVPEARSRHVNAKNGGSDKGTDKGEGEKISKWAIKKKKLTCYRCGEPGHFVEDCTTELCDYCQKAKHVIGECPLLSGPKPVVTIYGVCCKELMFFESPEVTSSFQAIEGSYPGVVKVTNGVMTEARLFSSYVSWHREISSGTLVGWRTRYTR